MGAGIFLHYQVRQQPVWRLRMDKTQKRGPTGAGFWAISTRVSSLSCLSAGYLALLPQHIYISFSDAHSFHMCTRDSLLHRSCSFFQGWRGHRFIFRKSFLITFGLQLCHLSNLSLQLWNGTTKEINNKGFSKATVTQTVTFLCKAGDTRLSHISWRWKTTPEARQNLKQL